MLTFSHSKNSKAENMIILYTFLVLCSMPTVLCNLYYYYYFFSRLQCKKCIIVTYILLLKYVNFVVFHVLLLFVFFHLKYKKYLYAT